MKILSLSTVYWLIFILIITPLFILIPRINKNDDFLSPISESISTSNIFYIAWAEGAFGRRCPRFDCELSHSFKAGESFKLPYPDFENMPEWVNLSGIYEKDCFVHKSVFSINPDTASANSSWVDRIARIVCDSGSGSGLLTWSEGMEAIITAKHVVENAKVCNIYLPKKGYKKLAKKSFLLHDKYDLAILSLDDFNNEYAEEVETIAKKPVSVCQSGVQRDNIFVYGYPDAVSKFSNNPAITSGIISNVIENYYFTDATIGPGNSGGVVTKEKEEENCYLGVPVRIERGEKDIPGEGIQYIENWGIILKANLLKYDETEGFSF